MCFENKAMNHFMVILCSLYLAKGNLYKVMKFPSMVTYLEEYNSLSKISCARLCASESAKCKAFYYNLSEQHCRLIDLDAQTWIAPSQKLLSGYVDLGI